MHTDKIKNPEIMLNKFTMWQGLKWLLYLAAFGIWIKTGMTVEKDSQSYINMLPMVGPGYPIFIKITTLFGAIHSYFLTGLVALLIGFVIVHRFVDFLKNQFNLSQVSVIASSIILLLPYFQSHIANNILTESVAYPLFIWAMHLFLKSAFEKNKSQAIAYLFVTVLLLLVRSQFAFFHIISFILILYLTWFQANKIKFILPLLGIFVFTVLSVGLIERTYHLALHNRFMPSPFIGIQLETMPLYNIQDKDLALFPDTIQQGLVDTVLSSLKKSELYHINEKSKTSEYEVFKYLHSYSLISWQTSVKYLSNILSHKNLHRKDMDYWIYIDQVTTKVAITLIKAHPKEYAWQYFADFKSAFGDWPFLIFFIIYFISGIIYFFKTGNKLSIFLVVSGLIMILNVTLICFFEFPIDRYLFYTQYLIMVVVFISIIKTLEANSQEITIN